MAAEIAKIDALGKPKKKTPAELRKEAKEKSLKIGRQNRRKRNTTARGPRDRY